MNNNVKKSQTSDLRKRAEIIIRKRPKKRLEKLTESEMLGYIHELDIHQVELEMINEELIDAQLSAELAAKKYSDLYNSAPLGYFTLNQKGEIIEVNATVSRMLGKKPFFIKNNLLESYISKEGVDEFRSFLEKIFTSKEKLSCEVEFNVEEENPLFMYLSGIVSENNGLCNIIATDITALKYIENQLLNAKNKAEESERLKSSFLANMSHEIRTPMNGILGFTQLLKKNKFGPERHKKFINIIEESGVRMLTILNDLINISKIESESMELLLMDFNLNEQMEYLYSFFKLEAKHKKLKFSLHKDVAIEKPFIIRTDKDKLNSILTNLLRNALKFTHTGEISFGYKLLKDSLPMKLEFFVKDTGIGVDHGNQEFIFDRFRQVSESITREYDGAGLGLAISKAFVDMMGGDIWIDSKKDSGSVFYFTLPYSPVQLEKTEQIHSNERVANTESLKDLKIILAENDIVSAQLIVEFLQSFCKQIIITDNGADTIEKCKQNKDVDLVLMDIKMPKMNGYEATRRIREFNKDIIIIAQTAYGLRGDKEKALEAGCNDYIAKPVGEFELMELIVKHLENN